MSCLADAKKKLKTKSRRGMTQAVASEVK